MPKRFNNLEAALKYLNPKGSDGDSTSEAPAGSQLRFYQDWRSGKRAIEYGDRDANSKPGDLQNVSVKPFAFPSSDTKEYQVELSARAKGQVSAAGVTLTLLGIDEDTANATDVINFKPAKVIITVVGTTSTNEESKITGRKYKKRNNSSYTFPFGRTTAEPTYASARANIANSAQASNRVVSFQPEIFA